MSGEMVAARKPGSGKFKVLEEAPGSYVKARSGAGSAASLTKTTAEKTASKSSAQKAIQTADKAAISEKAWTIKALDTSQAADDLTAINGIGPKLAAVLKDKGIASYAALAAKSAEEIKSLLLSEGAGYSRYDTSSWPEQAKSRIKK